MRLVIPLHSLLQLGQLPQLRIPLQLLLALPASQNKLPTPWHRITLQPIPQTPAVTVTFLPVIPKPGGAMRPAALLSFPQLGVSHPSQVLGRVGQKISGRHQPLLLPLLFCPFAALPSSRLHLRPRHQQQSLQRRISQLQISPYMLRVIRLQLQQIMNVKQSLKSILKLLHVHIKTRRILRTFLDT
jgi:hypothetical protein